MKRILAAKLNQHLNQPVMIRGWLHTIRALGKINFLIVRDRSGLAQVVVADREVGRTLHALQPGSVLRIEGTAIPAEKADLGVEIIDPKIDIEVPIHAVCPIDYYKPTMTADLEYILDNRPMALRNQKLQAIFNIQAEIVHAYRLYMHDVVGAVEYFAPNIIGASSEGGAEFFNVDYFGYTATLAQSSQLYKQIMVGVNERVFALMPFFRAENSNTPRHLTEGKQFEFEMGFFDHWHDVLDVQEGCIKYMIKHLNKHAASSIAALEKPLILAPENVPFPRLTFQEAQELFYKRTGIDERLEPDLSPAAERQLCAWAREEFGTDLVFVTDWKTSKRPFYSAPKEEDPTLTNTFDLLCAGTEITSGGQRRHTYDAMVAGIRMKGMDPANFDDYLSIFQFGMPPHGGFGMGLERLTMTFLGLNNIRWASLFPSDPRRIAGNRIKKKIFYGPETMRNEIVRLLRDGEIPFDHMIHPPFASPQEAAKSRNLPETQCLKSVLVRGKTTKKNALCVLPFTERLDMKAVAAALGEKCEVEEVEVIQERYGLVPHGVPPFGSLLNLETLFDSSVPLLDKVGFCCGMPTESLTLPARDLCRISPHTLTPITVSSEK